MISFMKEPWKSEQIVKLLNPIVKEWFFSKFKDFSEPQKYAIGPIHNGENILVSAVTGSGKTLTGFLTILNELITLSDHNLLENKVYCIYISPLKALNNDIHFNLITPLKEMEELSKKKFNIKVSVRTGDTTATEKQNMLKTVPHIIITTPESLAIMLTSYKFRELLRDVRYVIVDEVHALADNKRGVHLSLSLERLNLLTNKEYVRIGLGATSEPLEEIAGFLVGSGRDCKIANVDLSKKMDIKVLSPVPDLININARTLHHQLYTLIDNLIQEHRTTLIFTNTRSATERVIHHLKEKFPKSYTENIGAHHGSLSKSHRIELERRMREGKLKVVVSSTSLELGIDIGYIDLVIMLGSPKSVARAVQRGGRSGHKLHEIIKGRIIVLDRDDLIECSIMLKDVLERKIDRIHIPENALDVLAQQINGIAISDQMKISDVYKTVRKSYCYRNLDYKEFLEIINYLAGNYITLEDRNIYAKIWYDEESGMIGKRGKMGRVIYMTNIGTIPDESFIQVKINEQIIGSLDEGFLERLKRGDIFVLGGNTYEFLFARGQVAQVRNAVGKQPTVPSWFSEMLPLSFDLASDIGKFRRLMEEKFRNKRSKEEILKFINEYLYVDENSAEAIYGYFREQYLFMKEIPNDKKLIVERYNEEGRKYFIFHTEYGRRVNDVLSRVVGFAIGRIQHRDVEIGINDNGFYVASIKDIQVLRAFKLIKSKEIYEVAKKAIEKSEILKRRFRHCATRSLMILRQYKGKTKRVGRQQVSSMILLSAVRRIDENFCILKEARREVLEDLMDIDNAKMIIKKIEDDEIKIKEIETSSPSPFAFNLASQGYSDVLKIEDKIEFLRRMHNRVLNKIGDKVVTEKEFDYKDVWDKAEEKRELERDEKVDELKTMAYNLKHVPFRVKEEIVELVVNNKELSDDTMEGLKKWKSEIDKNWPVKLRKAVFEKVKV